MTGRHVCNKADRDTRGRAHKPSEKSQACRVLLHKAVMAPRFVKLTGVEGLC